MVTRPHGLICAGVFVCAAVDRLRPTLQLKRCAMQFEKKPEGMAILKINKPSLMRGLHRIMMETSLRLIRPRTDLPRTQKIRKSIVQ